MVPEADEPDGGIFVHLRYILMITFARIITLASKIPSLDRLHTRPALLISLVYVLSPSRIRMYMTALLVASTLDHKLQVV